jgi:hypothetical protein
VLRCLDNNNETQAIALLRAYEAVK